MAMMALGLGSKWVDRREWGRGVAEVDGAG